MTPTIALYEAIKNALLERGYTYWEAYSILYSLDISVIQQLIRELIQTLTEAQVTQLNTVLDTHADVDSFAACATVIGCSKESLQELHRQKLSTYLSAIHDGTYPPK